jgi:hypothetical protein
MPTQMSKERLMEIMDRLNSITLKNNGGETLQLAWELWREVANLLSKNGNNK